MVVFYRLRHATDNTKNCYVGSTKNLPRRKAVHKYTYNTPTTIGHNIKLYKYIREHGGYDNWCFDILDEKHNISKRDRHIREGMLIEQYNATLNVHDPAACVNGGATKSQKRAFKKYQIKHKEKIHEYNKQRNNTINVCEKCGVVYRGLNNKYIHQRTKKCLRHTPPVVNVNGDNNTVTVTI